MLNTLSGRLLILTVLFVMLAEVFIFVPSVARFREEYLLSRLERAQIASLAVEATDMISPELERELLSNAGVFNVVLRRDDARLLALSSPIPQPISATYDIRDPSGAVLIRDAIATLLDTEDRIVRVIGDPTQDAGRLIEVTMKQRPLRAAMLEYGRNILLLSAVISVITAILLFFALRLFLVRPIKGVVDHITAYAAAPEDARLVIEPSAGVRELRDAEVALAAMQTQLTAALRQKDRLAQLGGAVAKVSHDLRNILTAAQLFTDRIERSDDPLVKRMAPKLVGSISRAVSLCESTLAFGRADEPSPRLDRVALAALVDDVIEAEALALGSAPVEILNEVPADLTLRCDPEQMHRVLSNLVRNARQALISAGGAGRITLTAREDETSWTIDVADSGPGLPPKAKENLFKPFQGGVRKGGSGLGLVIADDLVRGHGGRLHLVQTGPSGTTFEVRLPKGDLTLAR